MNGFSPPLPIRAGATQTGIIGLIGGDGTTVQQVAIGTAAGTVCAGNDARLSDARTPLAHTHITDDITSFDAAVAAIADAQIAAAGIVSAVSPLDLTASNGGQTPLRLRATNSQEAPLQELLPFGQTPGNGVKITSLLDGSNVNLVMDADRGVMRTMAGVFLWGWRTLAGNLVFTLLDSGRIQWRSTSLTGTMQAFVRSSATGVLQIGGSASNSEQPGMEFDASTTSGETRGLIHVSPDNARRRIKVSTVGDLPANARVLYVDPAT